MNADERRLSAAIDLLRAINPDGLPREARESYRRAVIEALSAKGACEVDRAASGDAVPARGDAQ